MREFALALWRRFVWCGHWPMLGRRGVSYDMMYGATCVDLYCSKCGKGWTEYV